MGMFIEGRRTTVNWESGANIGLAYAGVTLQQLYNLNGSSNNQNVRITKAPCHFGGVRHYFHCPGCRRRRYKLRLGGSGFYCRQCYQLPYYSQQCGDLDGLIHKFHKLGAKLDGRPMRTATRMKLEDRLYCTEDRINQAFLNLLG